MVFIGTITLSLAPPSPAEEMLADPMGGAPPEYDFTDDGGWLQWDHRLVDYDRSVNLAFSLDQNGRSTIPYSVLVIGFEQNLNIRCDWNGDFEMDQSGFTVTLTDGECWKDLQNGLGQQGGWEGLGAGATGSYSCAFSNVSKSKADCTYTSHRNGNIYHVEMTLNRDQSSLDESMDHWGFR